MCWTRCCRCSDEGWMILTRRLCACFAVLARGKRTCLAHHVDGHVGQDRDLRISYCTDGLPDAAIQHFAKRFMDDPGEEISCPYVRQVTCQNKQNSWHNAPSYGKFSDHPHHSPCPRSVAYMTAFPNSGFLSEASDGLQSICFRLKRPKFQTGPKPKHSLNKATRAIRTLRHPRRHT